jgi:hypothetical protein
MIFHGVSSPPERYDEMEREIREKNGKRDADYQKEDVQGKALHPFAHETDTDRDQRMGDEKNDQGHVEVDPVKGVGETSREKIEASRHSIPCDENAHHEGEDHVGDYPVEPDEKPVHGGTLRSFQNTIKRGGTSVK